MNVLLDEDLPHKLRLHVPNHDVSTVAYRGWNGLKNGMLLHTAGDAGVEVFITADKNLSDQQNVSRLPFGVVALSTQDWPVLKLHLAKIAKAVDDARPGQLQLVECSEAIPVDER